MLQTLEYPPIDTYTPQNIFCLGMNDFHPDMNDSPGLSHLAA